MRNCLICSADISWRHHLAHYCGACGGKANKSGGAAQAHAAVARAVRAGTLARPSTLQCVDCGEQARDWDHRDYSKPLSVEPVCRSCNKKRGPALRIADLDCARPAPGWRNLTRSKARKPQPTQQDA